MSQNDSPPGSVPGDSFSGYADSSQVPSTSAVQVHRGLWEEMGAPMFDGLLAKRDPANQVCIGDNNPSR